MSREHKMTREEWLEYGLENKFCGPSICETHDGVPMTEDEEKEFFDGGDPCIPMIRLYADELEAMLVEQNHSPSQWRKSHPY